MPYLMTFLEGLLAFLSPCILPMLPVYLIYLAGDETRGSKQLLANTIAFVAGFSTLLILLGATASGIGRLLQAHSSVLTKIGGLIMVIMGVFYLEIPALQKLPSLSSVFRRNKEGQSQMKKSPGETLIPKEGGLHIGSSYLFGAAYSLTWSPCLSTWLTAALIQAGQAETMWSGILLLFLFSMGLGLPFILTALLFDQMRQLLDGIKKHMLSIKRVSGVLLILVGLSMIFGLFDYYARLFN